VAALDQGGRPRGSWGRSVAASVQGLTLVVLSLVILMTALGRLDTVLTPNLKGSIVDGMVAFGLVNPPLVQNLKGQVAEINYRNGYHEADATLVVPNDVTVQRAWVVADSLNCRVVLQGISTPLSVTTSPDGIIQYTSHGLANDCGDKNSAARWHIEVDVLNKHQALVLTDLGRIVLGGVILLGLLRVVVGSWRPRRGMTKRRAEKGGR
jgi:hypothetical protein